MSREKHWEAIYRTKAPTEVSWYQPEARLSLELIHLVAPGLDASVLDVGGGASTLADGLLSAGSRISRSSTWHQRLSPVRESGWANARLRSGGSLRTCSTRRCQPHPVLFGAIEPYFTS
jgi:hypothetical protein